MRKSLAIFGLALTTFAALPSFAADGDTPARQAVIARAGQMLYSAAGRPLTPIYKIVDEGRPQVIIEGRTVTVPVATLSMSGKKLTTSLSRADLRRMAGR